MPYNICINTRELLRDAEATQVMASARPPDGLARVFRTLLLPPILVALAQFALHVLLRPVIAHDLVDVALAPGIRLPLEHLEIRAPDDLLRLGHRHTALRAELGTVPQRFADAIFRPAVVEHVVSIEQKSLRIGFAIEELEVRAANDFIDVSRRPHVCARAGSDAQR